MYDILIFIVLVGLVIFITGMKSRIKDDLWTGVESCHICKCLIRGYEGYCVKPEGTSSYPITYYCHKCKPKYETTNNTNYYRKLRVTEDGEPVGYIKKK